MALLPRMRSRFLPPPPLPLRILGALRLKSFKVWTEIQIAEEIGYGQLGMVQDSFCPELDWVSVDLKSLGNKSFYVFYKGYC